MPQIVMETVHNMHFCEQCDKCKVWYVEGTKHHCEKPKQLTVEKKKRKKEVVAAAS